MRIPHKVVCLWSCLTAFTFIHTAVAQDYPVQPLGGGYVGNAVMEDETQDPFGDPNYYPLAYQDGAGVAVPDPMTQGYPPPMMSQYPPPQMPPGTSYWPNGSPYDPQVMDKTYRQNGIWMHEPVFGSRTYAFGLDYMRVSYARPGTDQIGSRNVVPGVSGLASPDAFEVINTGAFNNGNDLLSDGVRAKFLIQNADSSSLELSGFWVAESELEIDPNGRGNPFDPNDIRARGFIGLDNGTDVGTEMSFDSRFQLGYKAQAFGGDLTWSTMPFYETTGFRLRPLYGLKYLKIREMFTLHGEDSNLTYTLDPITGAPIAGTVGPNPFGHLPFASDLSSRTKSDLAGPEAGIRYELGGTHFLLSGQSRLALLANHEVIELSGNNFGDGFFAGFPDPTPDNPKPGAFRDGRTKTHLSPVFSQDFQFKGRVFKHLPFFKDSPLFANADMVVGYNFVLVGNVARPTKLIEWRTTPRIDLTHSRWWMQAATFGVQWSY